MTAHCVVELFAGPGGWSTGLRAAGHTGSAVGIEWDLPACQTATAAGHARICADVASYPTAVFADRITGLLASPPCPTFSMAGTGAGKLDTPNLLRLIADFAAHRRPGTYTWADERSRLTAEPMRWAVALRPRWIALEQVPSTLPVWRYMVHLLRELGYAAWCGILSAEEYGVPQTRERAILTASLDHSTSRPTPTHQPYHPGVTPQFHDDLFGTPLLPWVSMATALGWGDRVAISNYGTGGDSSDRGERTSTESAATVTSKVGRNVVLLRNGTQRNACSRGITEPSGTLFFSQRGNAVDWVLRNGPQENATERAADEPAGTVYCSRPGNLNWVHRRPATTVCGDARIGRPGHKNRDKGESQFTEQSVRISVQEAGILQGFPADYPWKGTKTQQYQQVGNAVPPPLAEAVLRPLLGDIQRWAT